MVVQECKICLIPVDDPDVANSVQFDESQRICAHCDIALSFLENLGFIESEYKVGREYWFYGCKGLSEDDYKFIPLVIDTATVTVLGRYGLEAEINSSPHKEELIGMLCSFEECKEFKDEQYHFDFVRAQIMKELARFKWFDKYGELMPVRASLDSLVHHWSSASLGLLAEDVESLK